MTAQGDTGVWPLPALADCAAAIVACPDAARKAELARSAADAWRRGEIEISATGAPPVMPDRPGRPERPPLLPPRDVPRRPLSSPEGRIALLHALAHIELNAVDLAWDLAGRFGRDIGERAFFDDWTKVGGEEGVHFLLLEARLNELGSYYGALGAHDGLWQAAEDTAHDALARLAVVPLVLEARGLDVSPGMIERLRAAGDGASANILQRIYDDEIGHVAAGMRWFA
ncbi:MAG: ferritin-like domain-containing protein, partial [bacterium]